MKETSHPPPGSKLLGFFVVPQKERHTREETEKLKNWKLKKQGRQKKKRRGRREKVVQIHRRFSVSEPRKKGKNRQICIFGFHCVAEYRDV